MIALLVTQAYTSYIIEHTYAKILASALERQVWSGDTNGDVVDH